MKRAVLLSGGQDSMALTFWMKPDYAITVDYGQAPASAEIRAAKGFCEWTGIPHEVIHLDIKALGSGEMVGTSAHPLAPTREWWPFRNQLLVTAAAMKGVQLGITEILIGTVKGDTIYADGREEFITALDSLLQLQEGALRLAAPAIHLTTPELILESRIPLGLLALAYSCHQSPIPCGQCRGCIKNQEVFASVEESRNLSGA